MIIIASKLFDKLLNIYRTQNDNLSEDQKKKINSLNRPENLTLDFPKDDLPPIPLQEADEKVKLEPEKAIAKTLKLNSQERKNKGTGLKVLTPKKLLNRLPI